MGNQQYGNQKRADAAAILWASRRPEIERLYVNGDWSQAQLAAHYQISQAGMQRALVRLGMPTKTRGRRGDQNGRFRDGSQSTIYRKIVKKDRCAKCGAAADLCIHHKDDNHTNNEPGNLEVLCMSCHSRMHKQAWWDSQRVGRS